jgi:hypothetical protein
MGLCVRDQQQWIVQPLIDAGPGTRSGPRAGAPPRFEGIVSEGRGTRASLSDLGADRSPEVRAAWAQMIGRMLVAEVLP